MLYRIGTTKEIPTLPSSLPDEVITEIFQGLIVLDAEYGEDRNYLESGGYTIIAENSEDISQIPISLSTPEWVTKISRTDFLSALYILNDDFSVMLYLQESIAPKSIINELEDCQ